jgi:hypothetical protein
MRLTSTARSARSETSRCEKGGHDPPLRSYPDPTPILSPSLTPSCLFLSPKIRIPRDAAGKPDPTNGKCSPPGERLACKYTKEARLALGVCLRTPNNTNVTEAATLDPFDYTECWVNHIEKWDGMVDAQIKVIKSGTAATTAANKGSASAWVKGQRTVADGIFKGDLVKELKGVADTIAAVLKDAGFTLVGDLAAVTLAQAIAATTDMKGVSATGMTKMWNEASAAQEGKFDRAEKDYRTEENPYKALYGDDWERQIMKHIPGQICVTHLVEHMIHASQASICVCCSSVYIVFVV